MKSVIVILALGLLLSSPISVKAQEVKQSDQPHFSEKDNTTAVKSKLVKVKETQPIKDVEKLNKKEGLYHIIVLTKDQKKESIWVELEPGEQKYVTIKLDNSHKKSVSIRLEDERKPNPIRVSPHDRLSQLMLQPISF